LTKGCFKYVVFACEEKFQKIKALTLIINALTLVINTLTLIINALTLILG